MNKPIDDFTQQLDAIMDSGASPESKVQAALELIRSETSRVEGREVSMEEIELTLSRVLRARGYRPDVTEVQEDGEEISLREVLRLARGRVHMMLKLTLISVFPRALNVMGQNYTSLSGGRTLTPRQVISDISAVVPIPNLTSEVVHLIEDIQAQRQRDPQYLPEDEEMEFLRKVLFLIAMLGIKDDMFCEFGQQTLEDLRRYVNDYVSSKSRH